VTKQLPANSDKPFFIGPCKLTEREKVEETASLSLRKYEAEVFENSINLSQLAPSLKINAQQSWLQSEGSVNQS